MSYLLALSLVANVIVVILAFWSVSTILDRRERSSREDRSALLATIDDLAQRIQAPDLAVIDHQARQGVIVNPPAVGFDSDEDYWRAAEMTKDQIAEQMMAHELAHDS